MADLVLVYCIYTQLCNSKGGFFCGRFQPLYRECICHFLSPTTKAVFYSDSSCHHFVKANVSSIVQHAVEMFSMTSFSVPSYHQYFEETLPFLLQILLSLHIKVLQFLQCFLSGKKKTLPSLAIAWVSSTKRIDCEKKRSSAISNNTFLRLFSKFPWFLVLQCLKSLGPPYFPRIPFPSARHQIPQISKFLQTLYHYGLIDIRSHSHWDLLYYKVSNWIQFL